MRGRSRKVTEKMPDSPSDRISWRVCSSTGPMTPQSPTAMEPAVLPGASVGQRRLGEPVQVPLCEGGGLSVVVQERVEAIAGRASVEPHGTPHGPADHEEGVEAAAVVTERDGPGRPGALSGISRFRPRVVIGSVCLGGGVVAQLRFGQPEIFARCKSGVVVRERNMRGRTVCNSVAVPVPAALIDLRRANPPAGTDVQQVLAIVVGEHHAELFLGLMQLSSLRTGGRTAPVPALDSRSA